MGGVLVGTVAEARWSWPQVTLVQLSKQDASLVARIERPPRAGDLIEITGRLIEGSVGYGAERARIVGPVKVGSKSWSGFIPKVAGRGESRAGLGLVFGDHSRGLRGRSFSNSVRAGPSEPMPVGRSALSCVVAADGDESVLEDNDVEHVLPVVTSE